MIIGSGLSGIVTVLLNLICDSLISYSNRMCSVNRTPCYAQRNLNFSNYPYLSPILTLSIGNTFKNKVWPWKTQFQLLLNNPRQSCLDIKPSQVIRDSD